MFKPLGFTIVFCMIASLISAMTLVPLCYVYYRPKEKENTPASGIMRALQNGYRSLREKLLKKKAMVSGTAVVQMCIRDSPCTMRWTRLSGVTCRSLS